MNFNYSQIFLLVWITTFWVYYFLTYGKVEGKHERTIDAEYGRTRLGFIFGYVLGSIIFILWTALILLYFFYYESVNWFWKISLLDHDFIKIFAIVIMCFTSVLMILFTSSVGKSIEIAVTEGKDEKPKLVTTGIYSYIRNPSYLALDLAVFGTFLIIPNLFTLTFLLYTIIVMYVCTLEEEKRLLKIYGEEYERYKKEVGRFLPKLKGGRNKKEEVS